MLTKKLNRKFPEFTAPFPAARPESLDYGQILQKSSSEAEKFAAEFAAAGNLENPQSRMSPQFLFEFLPEFVTLAANS